MSWHRIALAIGVLVTIAAAIGGFALGNEQAPTTTEADATLQAAIDDARPESEMEARAAGRIEGQQAGLERGRSDGRRAGAVAGQSAGQDAVDVEQAEIEAKAEAQAAAEAEAAASPEDLCASSIGDSAAYGQCLEAQGQDPGVPLTDYCAANPEIEASVGYCPSLNE